jgi:hypothetical protein
MFAIATLALLLYAVGCMAYHMKHPLNFKSAGSIVVDTLQAQKFFDNWNQTQYGGTLAPTVVFVETPPDGDAYMGQTLCDLKDDASGAEACQMYINPKFNIAEVTADETIIHESCHVKTANEFEDHGPRFQHCMLEVAMSGGFKGIW